MKREVAVILGVLVPFAVLVAFALHAYFAQPLVPEVEPGAIDNRPVRADSEPPTRVGSAARRPPGRAELALRPAEPPAPGAPPGRWAVGPPDASVPVEDAIPPTLEAPLRAVRPEVQRCWEDLTSTSRQPVAVEVRFRPLPDGGFTDVVVADTSWPDPWLGLCLQDVFEEVGYTPTGREDFAPARHRFVFDQASARE